MSNAWVREIILSFDLSITFMLLKIYNSFLGGLYKCVVILGDILYYHTTFYIGVEVL